MKNKRGNRCIRPDCPDKPYAAKLCKSHYKEEFKRNASRFGEFAIK